MIMMIDCLCEKDARDVSTVMLYRLLSDDGGESSDDGMGLQQQRREE